MRSIRVRGAREHNLKGVDIDIPRDVLTVITGVSGSGKSSLAFDTLFAEGQRKYMESLSAYARQFLDQLSKPDVEQIDGLTPTIAIEQRAAGRNPRSTVATTTEVYDYLRLLFARAGEPTCWAEEGKGRCGRPIHRASPGAIYEAVSGMAEGTRMMVLAPIVRGKKGHHKEALEGLLKEGYVRARVNGVVVDLSAALSDAKDPDNPLALGRYERHDIEVVVDRLVVREDMRSRLVDSVETGLRAGSGVVITSVPEPDGSWEDTTYSEHYACAVHPACSLEELEPRLFSFNSHYGYCPDCQGLGEIMEFDPDLCMPDPEAPLDRGGVAPLKRNGPGGMWIRRLIGGFSMLTGLPRDMLAGELTDAQRRVLLYGTTEADVETLGGDFEGVLPMLEEWRGKTESPWVRDFLPKFMSSRPCGTCQSRRLNIKALSVFLTSSNPLPPEIVSERTTLGLSDDAYHWNVSDFTSLSIADALAVLDGLTLEGAGAAIATPIVREVKARLGFLASVGLQYLSLDRKTSTLSGGEAQRIRLASQVGSGIVGATYVLDEPTIGLHARDNDRLIRTLRHLSDIGNTVLVVEHDEAMIRSADHLVDMGPGPGVHGGCIVGQGDVADLIASPESLTGQYLSGAREVSVPASRRPLDPVKWGLHVKGARHHNLKSVDVSIPLGGLVSVTGVSGSGKSTLVNETLLRGVARHLGLKRTPPGPHDSLTGLEAVTRIVEVDQTPIGRTPRSNPATYTSIFDGIRKLFAMTPDARQRGYKAGRFSFNVKGGRCDACQGQGVQRIAMHFLPDVHVTCDVCEGRRYNADTLDVRFKGLHIAEVLDLTFEAARTFFQNHAKILRMVECMCDVGLGYLTLGQPSTQLSGGEAQRVKLATELGRGGGRPRPNEHTLYILDEPTTGLHFEDVRRLVDVLQGLVDRGNTVVVIEHNLDVIKCSDWVIDLGPEGGDGGGEIVGTGRPEDLLGVSGSHTGRYLRDLLAQ
ncbi:MAG: excinuclease ABC subunit UvrA [Myxococcota bacterium]